MAPPASPPLARSRAAQWSDLGQSHVGTGALQNLLVRAWIDVARRRCGNSSGCVDGRGLATELQCLCTSHLSHEHLHIHEVVRLERGGKSPRRRARGLRGWPLCAIGIVRPSGGSDGVCGEERRAHMKEIPWGARLGRITLWQALCEQSSSCNDLRQRQVSPGSTRQDQTSFNPIMGSTRHLPSFVTLESATLQRDTLF